MPDRAKLRLFYHKKKISFIIIFQNRKSKIHLLNMFFGSWYLTFQSVKRTPCQSYTSVSPQCLHALLPLRAQGLWYQQWLPAVGELCPREQNNGPDSPLSWHSESCSFIHSQDSANGWVLLSTLQSPEEVCSFLGLLNHCSYFQKFLFFLNI